MKGFVQGKKALIKGFCILLAMVLAVFIAVNLIKGILRKKVYPIEYKQEVCAFAVQFGLDERLIFSVIKVESSFNPNAVSPAGAVGLMQLKPNTASFMAKKLNIKSFDLYSPKDNLLLGCAYLRYLMDKFILLDTCLCAYNAGEGKVKSWLSNGNYSKDGLSLNKIPYKETEEYIKKIHLCLRNYGKLYGNFLDKSTKFS